MSGILFFIFARCEPLKLNSYSNAKHFFNDEWWAAAFPFKTPSHCLALKCSCRAFYKTNRILCHECETLLKLNFFQLMELYRSWDSVLTSIYRIDAHELKNGNAHVRERWKKHLAFEYELSLTFPCTEFDIFFPIYRNLTQFSLQMD